VLESAAFAGTRGSRSPLGSNYRRPASQAGVLSFALLVVLAVDVDAEAPVPERHVAVWLQPLGLTFAPAAVAIARAGTYVAVPLGLNLALEQAELAIEATVYTYRNGSTSAFTGGTLTLGPVLHTGHTRFNGFMLIPKLAVDVMHEFSRNVTGLSVLPGIDAGWQHTFGPFYLAVVVGVSAGWSFADGDWIEGPGLNPTLPVKSRPVVGVNLNLLRLGAAF
jgi:hypothetical protein